MKRGKCGRISCMKTVEQLKTQGLQEGEVIIFTSPEVEATFIWLVLEDQSPETVFQYLTESGVIIHADNAYDWEDTFEYEDHLFPSDFEILSPEELKDKPYHLGSFTEPIVFENLQLDDMLLVKSNQISIFFPITEESLKNLKAWDSFNGITADEIFKAITKSDSYELLIQPRNS